MQRRMPEARMTKWHWVIRHVTAFLSHFLQHSGRSTWSHRSLVSTLSSSLQSCVALGSFHICKMGIALRSAAGRVNERNALVCLVPTQPSPWESLSV